MDLDPSDIEAMSGEIRRLAKERRALVMAHTYQSPEVQLAADFVGDSLELSRMAAKADNPVIVFCGVRFMAETAKLLAPERRVLLPAEHAGCPMADSITAEDLRAFKVKHPGLPVVTYVNSTAEVKAESDYCCTSANALRVIEAVPSDELICVPDRNLAQWCQSRTSKKIHWWDGFCLVHVRITREDAEQAKRKYPDALLLAHPECEPEVLKLADEVLSTSQIIGFAAKSDARRFLIATEAEVVWRLRRDHPDREFYTVGPARHCVNMKKTRLPDVLRALKTLEPAIELDKDLAARARLPIERMLAIG
jgi:quinolinate synthase